MKLLIVDDSDFSRLTLQRVVAEVAGLEIAEASNGIEALEQHRIFRPDIIFMDVTMPHLDGLTTLKIVRAIDKKVRIIMITALGTQQYLVDECHAVGISAILAKPILRDVILQAFQQACLAGEGENA